MIVRSSLLIAAASLLTTAPALAEGPRLPPGDREPILRLEPEGPTSLVTGLTFSPDGQRLYAAGFDKLVRIWALGNDGAFTLDKTTYRVPIRPGIDGTINAMALSPDDVWLAVGGQAIVRGTADFRTNGWILPKLGGFTRTMWEDQGLIYVFNVKDRSVRLLRGHLGPVWSLAFAPAAAAGKPPLLISAGRDRDMVDNTYRSSVRVWDLDNVDKPVAVQTDLPATLTRPGLAAWYAGEVQPQLRVAIAWGDGKLRVWDVAAGRLEEAVDGFNGERDGRLNVTCVYLPEPKQLLTTTFRLARDNQKAGAQLRLWDVRAAAPVSVKAVSYGVEHGYPIAEPLAMALVSSDPKKPPDHAAILVRPRQEKDDSGALVDAKDVIRLMMIRIDKKDFGLVRQEIDLWKTGGKMPVIASVPGGRFLAVAGSPDHSIRVYPVADVLTKGKESKYQSFKGVGLTWTFVAFVRKGQDRGLILSRGTNRPLLGKTPAVPDGNSVIFNITQRVFTDKLDGWKIDAPDVSGMSASHVALKRDPATGRVVAPAAVSVTVGDGQPARVLLAPGEEVSHYALVPSLPPYNVPLVAVGAHELDQPTLALYNAATGARLRQLVGHGYKIRCLAFSGDGRFLASVADDQTLCVWSQAKLEMLVGKLGMLPETVLQNQMVVASVAGPARGQLKEYERIEGIVDGAGRLERFFSIRELHYRITAQVAPGTRVTLRVRSEDGKVRDESITAGTALVPRNQALLAALGATNPLMLAALTPVPELYSPLSEVVLKYAPTVAAAPAGSKLVKGDVIEGYEVGKKLVPTTSAIDTYRAVALVRPASLRVRGKGNVPIQIGQGATEQKPLFTLFATGAGAAAQWDWVGWSPIGPFESGGRRAERYVGWHFNTGDPLAPTAFALIEEYHRDYYRDGILRHLINRGDLVPALRDWIDERRGEGLPRPKMTLYADEVGPDPEKRNGLGQVVVRRRPLTLRLAVDDFPIESVAGVSWQVDGGPLQAFPATASAREWAADVDLPQGAHVVHALLRTRESPPAEYARELTLRVVPPAPAVLAAPPPDQVAEAAFPFRAQVRQGRPDQEVEVRLTHVHQGKPVHGRRWTLKKHPDAEQTLELADNLELKPGANLISVVAVNVAAAKEDEALETVRRSCLITYVPPGRKAVPPRIALVRVAAAPPNEPDVQPVEAAQAVVVRSSSIQVEGTVAAADGLTDARWGWVHGDAPVRWLALDGFVAEQKKLAFAQAVTLEPGAQKFVVRARSAGDVEETVELKIDYRPPLPRLALRLREPVIYDDGQRRGPPRAEVVGSYLSTSPVPFTAVLLVNGEARGPVPVEGAEWLKAVPLSADRIEHRLQVRLENAHGVYVTEPVTVRFLRPPQEISFEEAPGKPVRELHVRKMLVDLTARVKSARPLVPASLTVQVNGREVPSARLAEPTLERPEWTIFIANVPLEADRKNLVRVWVSNVEARCLKPGEVTVTYEPPAAERQPPAAPEVTITEPGNGNATDPEISIRARVQSATPLKRVEIVWESEDQPLERTPVDLAGFAADSHGVVVVRRRVSLAPGVNRLSVVAVNDGGERADAVVVNRPHVPVRLLVDEIRPAGDDGESIRPILRPEGLVAFPVVLRGQVLLSGRVTWSKDDDALLKRVGVVRVYVNGFQQVAAPLRLPTGDAHESRFTARVVLNRARDNEVQIELPNAKQDHGNRHQRRFLLDCAQPHPGQRLHLLVVGVGVKDGKKLVDEALASVRARADRDGVLHAPAFSKVHVYGPLIRFVKPEDVFTQLCIMKRSIDILAARDTPSDVVMVYYKGDEAIEAQGNYFATSVTEFDPDLKRSGITYSGLQQCFGETLGAKLLMLDVARAADSRPAQDEVLQAKDAPTYFGVLRYRWLPSNAARAAGDLISDWKTVLSLQEVERLRSATAALLKKGTGKTTFDRYVPAGLLDLRVDQKTEKP